MFLDIGYTPDYFWDCSIQEIKDLIESYNRRRQREREEEEAKVKMQVELYYILSQQITNGVACVLSNKAKPIPLQKWYPSLYPQEETNVALYNANRKDRISKIRASRNK